MSEQNDPEEEKVSDETIFKVFNWLIVAYFTSHLIMTLAGVCIFPPAECYTMLFAEGVMAVLFLFYFFAHRDDAEWINRVVFGQKVFFGFFLFCLVGELIFYIVIPSRYCDTTVVGNTCDQYFKKDKWGLHWVVGKDNKKFNSTFLGFIVFMPLWFYCV